MRKSYSVSPGDTFEDWTVLEYKSGSKTPVLVRCTCGNESNVQAHALVNGLSKRCRPCGHKVWAQSRAKPEGWAMRTRVYTQYSSAAKKRGHSFSLTKDEFYAIIEKDCHYCGTPPNNVMKTKNANGEYVYNGVDRFDSSIGYETGNVFPCCKNCNYMKRDLTYDEFISHIRLILKRVD